jgi:Tfp pilus assembly protein FimT
MNEKVIAIIALVIAILLAVFCTGCATRPVVVATDESIVSSQVSVAKLQAVNDGLRDILQIYDRQITEQSGRAIRGIDDALDRLGEYDDFVQGLIRRIRELELATRSGERESQDKE